jgi:hypothetical protein
MRTDLRTIVLPGIAFVAGFVLSYIVFAPSHSSSAKNTPATASSVYLAPLEQWKEAAVHDRDVSIKGSRGVSVLERENINAFRFPSADLLALPAVPAPAAPSDRLPVRWPQPQVLQLPNLRIIEHEPGLQPPNWREHSTDLLDFRYRLDFRLDRAQ